MAPELSPREELLGLVRTLAGRVRVDRELGKPLSWLTRVDPDPAEIAGKGPMTAAPGRFKPAPLSAGLRDAGTGVSAAGALPALESLRMELGECRLCPLGARRRRLVFGEGNPRADLVFVGEAPGAEEDLQGRPFVGAAGQLLTKIIAAMGLTREEVYICNILKCRPPGNRNPLPEEIAACEPFLVRQLEAIGPKVICALGSFAAHTLLKTETPITVLRGRFHRYQGIPLMPTYHPAYLLRNPGAKKQTWEDVQQIMKALKGEQG
jgi:DNA polymerase